MDNDKYQGLIKMLTSTDFDIVTQGCELIENLHTEMTIEEKLALIEECYSVYDTDEEVYGRAKMRFLYTEVQLVKDNYTFKNLA